MSPLLVELYKSWLIRFILLFKVCNGNFHNVLRLQIQIGNSFFKLLSVTKSAQCNVCTTVHSQSIQSFWSAIALLNFACLTVFLSFSIFMLKYGVLIYFKQWEIEVACSVVQNLFKPCKRNAFVS